MPPPTSGRYRRGMDIPTATLILIIAGGLLAFIIGCLIQYAIIRTAVSHALARHRDELRETARAR